MPSEKGQRNRSVRGGIIAPWNNDTWLPYNITLPSTHGSFGIYCILWGFVARRKLFVRELRFYL